MLKKPPNKFEYQVHEFAKQVPRATGRKFSAIVRDIKKSKGKLVEKIVRFQGKKEIPVIAL